MNTATTQCDTTRHLLWTLGIDWGSLSGGAPLRAGWLDRATAWRAGRRDTADWVSSLSPAKPPSWDALRQAHVEAGLESTFRTGPAFCRGRRYGWYPDLEAQFVRKLNADAGDDTSPIAQGIRGFLDIIYVHPFPDGNSRAACAWLTWSLVGAGFDVPDLTGLMKLPKPVANDRVVALMATEVHHQRTALDNERNGR